MPADATLTYLEAADDRGGFASASFSLRQQKASAVYYLKEGEDETAAILDLLGDVKPNGAGGLNRTLPRCHPKYPWLYAGAVAITGRGLPARVPSSQAYASIGAEPTTDEYLEWPVAAIQVEYGPLAFAVLPDEKIACDTVDWIDFDGTKYETPRSNEYTRFCWVDYTPKVEVITATQGQMVFRAQAAPPNMTSFSGRPQLRMPGGRVDIHWVQVPYSWVTADGAYIARFQGRINQTQFMRWNPGELLYDSATVTPYPPPVPSIDESLGDGVFSPERLCDIVLHCVEAIRKQPDQLNIPNDSDIVNKNWIVGGHNLLPHVRFGFVYATAVGMKPSLPGLVGPVPETSVSAAQADDQANKDQWRPTFDSFPLELLFSDPTLASTTV